MKRILGVLLAGVLLLSGCGQWQKSQKESRHHLKRFPVKQCILKTSDIRGQNRHNTGAGAV